MTDKQDIQVFGVSRDGEQITGSTTLEALLGTCEDAIPIGDIHVLIMDNGTVGSKKIGRIGLHFYPEDGVLREGEPEPKVQIQARLDTTLPEAAEKGLKIKPLKGKGKKRGRPRKVKNE
jgi:hypothetical protein